MLVLDHTETLLDIVHLKKSVSKDFLETYLLHIMVTPVLEALERENNLINNLIILSLFLYVMIICAIFACGFWTWKNRESPVVKASQPIFLWIILGGTFSLSTTIIPLSIDDGNTTKTVCDMACRTLYWFPSIGVTLIFTGLFAKSWRLNKILHSSLQMQRVVVKAQDVMIPLIILLSLNVITLLTWNIVDPLTYLREPHEGTDMWNRIISTYGRCQSQYQTIFQCLLIAICVISMVLASVYTWMSRRVITDFNETKYIGAVIIVFSKSTSYGINLLNLSIIMISIQELSIFHPF